MKHLPRLFALLALSAMLAPAALGGCASLTPPNGEPSIRGSVTSITPRPDGLGIILVEETSPQGLEFDKASLAITKDTKLLKRAGDDYVEFTFNDIRAGVVVEVWITGPVRESYPIQADADTVVELE
jgi:hypothetical protein